MGVVVVQIGPRLGQFGGAQILQIGVDAFFHRVHGVQTGGRLVEPHPAGLAAQIGVGTGGHHRLAQPHEFGPFRRVQDLRELGDQTRLGELGEDLEGSILGIDQLQQTVMLGGGETAGGQAGGGGGAFLAGEFLALHEIEHGHQGPRNGWVGVGVRRLEHHRQQAGDDVDEEFGGVFRADLQGLHPGAQGIQGVQGMQGIGDTAEHPGRERGGGSRRLEAVEQRAHAVLGLHRIRRSHGQPLGKVAAF